MGSATTTARGAARPLGPGARRRRKSSAVRGRRLVRPLRRASQLRNLNRDPAGSQRGRTPIPHP